ncbi:MAG: hypothetical protein ACI83W_002577 [Marinoscillum sp.]
MTPGLQENYSVAVASGSPTNYQWIIPTGCSNGHCWSVISGQGTRNVTIQAGLIGNNQRIECRVYNGCGYDVRYHYVNVTSSGGPCGGLSTLAIYPNPSDGDFIAEIVAPCLTVLENEEDKANNKYSALFISKLSGEVVYERNGVGKKVTLNNLKLESGVYILDYLYKNERFQQKLIID